MMLLSWFDIRKVLAAATRSFTVYPDGIVNIQCFSDAIEVECTEQPSAEQWFHDKFKNKWNNEHQTINYDITGSQLNVIFSVVIDSGVRHNIKPLWQDIGYIESGDAPDMQLKAPETDDPSLVAFYSFKGGVGRTTSLLTYMSALIENHRNQEDKTEKTRLLLIDADLEAPGITYLLTNQQRAEVSWIQFMASMQYPVSAVDDVVDVYAKELKKVSIEQAGVEIFILPAFSGDVTQGMSQVADVQVKPEHLVRTIDSPWHCTDIILQLSKKLAVDCTFIDLRAGVSELSSPLLFDPRVERFVVTTMAEQAISGTEYVLSKMMAMAGDKDGVFDETRIPSVITTFVTKEFKDSNAYQETFNRLIAACDSGESRDEDGYVASGGANIVEGEFSAQLLHISTLADYITTIMSHSSLYQSALSWAKAKTALPDTTATVDGGNKEQITKLKTLVASQIYAEKAESEALLVTEPLRNLAKRHVTSLPKITSIGSKGSGKTFNFIQLCRKSSWYAFVNEISPDSIEVKDKALLENTFIFPLIHSFNLQDRAQEIINQSRQVVLDNTGGDSHYTASIFEAELAKEKVKPMPDWNTFWQKQFWLSLYPGEAFTSIAELNQRLKEKALRVVFVLDGLEDIFCEIELNQIERDVLHSLAYLPNQLNELPNNQIGLISFFREDYIERVVIQNLGQYRDRYQPYQLTWDGESFLKLVYWTCQQAGLTFAEGDVQTLRTSEIAQKLTSLWGLKLGKPTSREANTIRWVYAALSDLRGRLQARDIIRFLNYACESSLDTTVQPEDRLLAPASLRTGVKLSSGKKVEEAKKEFKVLESWISKLNEISATDKSVPFSAEATKLEPDEIRSLIDLGIIYEEKGTSADKRYYLPELFREGLGFTLTAGARPKVLVMLKESLGKLPIDI